MSTGKFWALGAISDDALRGNLAQPLTSGYRTEARIIAHLAEVEQRKLHLLDGSDSLFAYCIGPLGLSHSEAYHRITASRIARRYPIVFELLEQRALHLSALCLLRDYLRADNHREPLSEACHKTKLQVQALLAQRFPRPDVASHIRKLPAPKKSHAQLAGEAQFPAVPGEALPPFLPTLSLQPLIERSSAKGSDSSLRLPPPSRALIEPLSEARYRIQLNARPELKEKLERLRGLLSHSNPSGDLALVVERALDIAIEHVEKQRFARTAKPRPASAEAAQGEPPNHCAARRREHIPNAVRREVVTRDGMRCTYESASGQRCNAQAFLQLHHEQPWARGGPSSSDNLRLLCAAHNGLLAEKDFGAAHIASQREAVHDADVSRS